ncbi:MAG: hypothetical protein CFE23_13820 [Flavobacterium sp. BFFFF1]|uniref:DUF1573 domain-containing protein n=1 Tax=unclassified Flavobacterium TaxID=196869 RepID=UPI000BCEEFDB|nr:MULTISPECIES: DUF1573 domain-containing protein [unclassified Flavobacterium]OYU79502.1 MAG: hypothetical protein CFE23_13820 [Flavobacterium sp. BFFFF1]
MKKNLIVFSAMALFAMGGAFAQETSKKSVKKTVTTTTKAEAKKVVTPAIEGAGMVFENETIDYGTVEHNADGKREFVFVNNGNKPLVISQCTGSCGCTVPSWPKEPIAPGAKAVIGVKYATDRVGQFTKTVTVTSNASETPKVLTIKGNVLPDPAPKETPTKS